MAMALRALAGKLRPPSAREAASRAFSYKCEHCGKTSSEPGYYPSLKNEAMERQLREELKWFNRKHNIFRTVATIATFGAIGMSGKYALDLLESDDPLHFIRKFRKKKDTPDSLGSDEPSRGRKKA